MIDDSCLYIEFINFNNNNKLQKYFITLLDTWHYILNRTHDNDRDKPPYSYGERANVGYLHAAAHVAGYTGCEEFYTIKGDDEGDAWTGRTDLAIKFNDSYKVVFEAKHASFSFDSKKSFAGLVEYWLDDKDNGAISQVNRIELQQDYSAGILFILPFVHESKEKKWDGLNFYNSFKEKVSLRKKMSFWAFHGIRNLDNGKEHECYCWEFENNSRYYYPGLGIICEVVCKK